MIINKITLATGKALTFATSTAHVRYHSNSDTLAGGQGSSGQEAPEKHTMIELMDDLTSMLSFYRQAETLNVSHSRFGGLLYSLFVYCHI